MNGVALVTGGASGIGAATCRRFLQRGVTRLAVADWNVTLLNEFATNLQAEFSNAKIIDVELNVGNEVSVAAMMEQVVAAFGRVDYAVNCAGTGSSNDLHEFETGEWNRIVQVNQTGLFFCLRAEIGQMLKQEPVQHSSGPGRGACRGAIVSIASTAGFRPLLKSAAYTATKHAVVGLTRSAAFDNARNGIRVNGVAPGLVLTPLTVTENTGELIGAANTVTIPQERPGQPEELADVITFMCSEDASYVNGAVWQVDGGLML